LDVDGSWIYLPKRTNVRLAKPESVAKSISRMIIKRKDKITLTRLGLLANYATRYLPKLSHWIVWTNREKIKEEFTLIGGPQVLKALKPIPSQKKD